MQSLPNGTILGEYTLIRLIGRGGMGEVYEAHEAKLSRRVALKIIAPSQPDEHDQEDLFRRFIQEARTLAQVNHPNVVTIYNVDRIGTAQFIAMEYVPGLSLKQIQKEASFHFEEAIPIFAQILEGLGSLHDNHIVHRDLKPHNILVRRDGQVKILDFGIAKQMLPGLGEGTMVGVIAGTLPYMAPEIKIGEPAHPGSDIYSLGAIFYEMLVGKPLARVLMDFPDAKDVPFSQEDNVRIPEELRNIIRKMCLSNPKERYSRTTQVAEDIKKFRQSRPAPPPEIYESLVKRIAQGTEKQIRDAGGEPSIFTSVKASPLPTDLRVTRERRKAKRKQKSFFEDLLPAIGLIGLILTAGLAWWLFKSPAPTKVTMQPPPMAAPTPAPKPVVQPPRPAAPESAKLSLLDPKDLDILWLEPSSSPTFSWTHPLNSKDYEIQISRDAQFRGKTLTAPVNGNAYRPEEELPEGIFYWRLKPNQSWAPTVGPNKFLLAYKRPVDLTRPKAGETYEVRGANSQAKVDFQWTCKLGIKSYRVQLGLSNDFSAVRNEEFLSTCQMKGVKVGAGNYFWRVGINPPGSSETLWSEARGLDVRVYQPPVKATPKERDLSAPKIKTTLVRHTLNFKGQPRDLASLQKSLTAPPLLRWGAVRGAHSYLVQFSPSADFSSLLSEEKTSSTKLIWRNVIPGTTYFRVRALTKSGQVSPPSAHGTIESRLPAPSIDSEIKIALNEKSKEGASVSWTPVPLAAQYLVKVGPKENLARVKPVPVEDPTYTFAGTPGKQFLSVAAANSDGEILGPYSKPSTVVLEENFQMEAVKNLTPGSGARAPASEGRLSVKFTWTPAKSAEFYIVELAKDEEFKEVLKKLKTNQPSYLLKQAELSGRVYWRVRPESSKGQGEWSSPSFFDVR